MSSISHIGDLLPTIEVDATTLAYSGWISGYVGVSCT